ncbi:transketolase [Chromobacterium subtsugae]|nr:transketolase [Chromobacterium subtsugae]MBW7565234.1 transketolase [Chromobacterium subtsugae]WSE91710.1 transketolase [Chromobacterium subtsugae]WVH60085.1 transketolase [Chromobacterium subtsugae]
MTIDISAPLAARHPASAPILHAAAPDGLTLAAEAKALRLDIIRALHAVGGGHYGGSLSCIDLLLVLYRRCLRVAPAAPGHPERDRLILSKGHSAVALYAVLRRLGFFSEPLDNYADFDSILEGHPDMLSVPGVDFSSGSLGQGLSVGIGMALALRGSAQRTWVVLGDGECQEGQVWEAAMLAAACGLDHIHAIVDCNRFQEWGWAPTPDAPHPEPVPQMAAKWRAFGWHVIECDGHDHQALELAVQEAQRHKGQPSVILARTQKGKGVPLVEAAPWRFHCETVSDEEHDIMLRSLA